MVAQRSTTLPMIRLRVLALAAEASSKVQPKRRVGRYGIFGEIASGGMATVYVGRLMGAVGFSRSVAIKQLHPQYARSPEFVAQFLDEARLTARIRHPNVVQVLDVVARDGELFVIMEYVEGEPLSRLARAASSAIPLPIVSSIIVQALLGLHAAHDATSDGGVPLEIVHRDVSPQNILVGIDGISHILDFGVAKASSRVHTTENGQIKGKLSYMAPEQLQNLEVDRRCDIFATGVVLWELLCGKRLFARNDPGATVAAVLSGKVPPPRELRPDVSPVLEAVVLKALAPDREQRFATARDMAIALEHAIEPASALKTGTWVEGVAKESLVRRAALLREAEEESSVNKVTDLESLQRSLSGNATSAPPPPLASVGDETVPALEMGVLQRQRRTRLALAAGAGALLLGVVAWRLLASSSPTPSAQEPSVSAAAIAPATVVTPPAVANPPSAPVAAPRDLAVEAAPAAEDAGKALASGPTTKSIAKPAGAAAMTKKPVAKTKGGVDCSRPFVLDAQGHKRFKPECF